jgi:DNA-binding beta-propeller fold protein YncE
VDGESQWPDAPENVEVDDAEEVWVTGWQVNDHVILRFSADGKFLRQYGQKGKSGGNDSTEWFKSPPSVYHDVKNQELFVADGYGNQRIIAIDSETGKFTRMWGAYGRDPSSLSPEESYGRPVHRIARSPDGLLYVCDRSKNRVQEFELVPDGVRYLREVIIAPGTGMMGSSADVAFSSDNKYMYVTDMMGMRIWSIDRQTFEVLGWANAAPETEGADNIGVNRTPLHRMTILPNGDLILTRGRKGVQVMKYLGVR